MGKPAVLLLERDPTIIDIAQRCLVEEAELHIANSVELALRIAARRPIAVAVLDAPMAGAMPSDVVGKLRNLSPGLRVVFLADASFDLDKRYTQLGTQIRKPVNDERMLNGVMSALRMRNMSANVERMRSTSGAYPRPLRPPPPSAPFGFPLGTPLAGAPHPRPAGGPPPRAGHFDDDETEDHPSESIRADFVRGPATERPRPSSSDVLKRAETPRAPPSESKRSAPPAPPSSTGKRSAPPAPPSSSQLPPSSSAPSSSAPSSSAPSTDTARGGSRPR